MSGVPPALRDTTQLRHAHHRMLPPYQLLPAPAPPKHLLRVDWTTSRVDFMHKTSRCLYYCLYALLPITPALGTPFRTSENLNTTTYKIQQGARTPVWAAAQKNPRTHNRDNYVRYVAKVEQRNTPKDQSIHACGTRVPQGAPLQQASSTMVTTHQQDFA